MNQYYVYLWKRKSDDFVFHVGFGHGKRMYNVKDRNIYFKRFYNKYDCYVCIYKDNLTDDEAAKLEKDLITYYKSIGQASTNIHEGGHGGNTLKYMSKDKKDEFKRKISLDSKKKWNDLEIRERMLETQRIAMQSRKVRNKISNKTKEAMQRPEVRQHHLDKIGLPTKIVFPDKTIKYFDCYAEFTKYMKKTYRFCPKRSIICYNGDYHIKCNSNKRTKQLIGLTFIVYDNKTNTQSVTTICDECSRVDKK